MKYIIMFAAVLFSTYAVAQELGPEWATQATGGLFTTKRTSTTYTAMELLVKSEGATSNEKFFEGPLPEIGQCIEYVRVVGGEDGAMRFQFRTKECGK